MSEHAKSARAAMKAKAKRMGDAGDPKARVDASSWTPPEMENSGAKTGMRPISKRAFKRGGKVMHVEGEKAHHHAGRKPRSSGGEAGAKAEQFMNRNYKEANEKRAGGKAHVGGYKRGGKTEGHPDEAADRALVKKMVKGTALTGKKHGGEAGEKWIAGAIKHPGALHKSLHVPAGEKIPAKKLAKAAHSDNPKLAKRANLAMTLKRMHKKEGGYAPPDEAPMGEALYRKNPSAASGVSPKGGVNLAPQEKLDDTSAEFLARKKAVDALRGPPPGSFKRGGKAEHGAGCRCHKCMGGKAGKGHGGVAGDPGGERPTGGRVARKDGGKVGKGKTNVNIIISAGHRPEQMGMPPAGVPGGAGGPGASPAVMPRQAPVMPPAAPPMPMGAPPMGGAPQMGPPGTPMARKAGGRVYRSYKDMDAGSGSGLGRLEKTEIEGRKK